MFQTEQFLVKIYCPQIECYRLSAETTTDKKKFEDQGSNKPLTNSHLHTISSFGTKLCNLIN